MTGAVAEVPVEGQLVHVRRRPFVVEQVKAGGINGTAQHPVTLSSMEEDATRERLRVVWELEPGAGPLGAAHLPDPDGFDSPARLGAVRWGPVSTADIRSLQSPFRSGIAIEDCAFECHFSWRRIQSLRKHDKVAIVELWNFWLSGPTPSSLSPSRCHSVRQSCPSAPPRYLIMLGHSFSLGRRTSIPGEERHETTPPISLCEANDLDIVG